MINVLVIVGNNANMMKRVTILVVVYQRMCYDNGVCSM